MRATGSAASVIAAMGRLCLGFALVWEARAEYGTPTGRSAHKHG